MNKRFIPVMVVLLVIVCGVLSEKLIPGGNSYKLEYKENIDTSTIDSIISDQYYTRENSTKSSDQQLVDYYNDSVNKSSNNSGKLQPPQSTTTTKATVNFDTMLPLFQQLYSSTIGTSQIVQEEPFDGTLGTGTLEIYKKDTKGLYKFRYVYSETPTDITQGVELNYGVTSTKPNVDAYHLDEVHRIMTGVSLEPYVKDQMNACLEDYQKVAQISGTTAIDPNSKKTTDFNSGGVSYRISTVGTIITISSTVKTAK